MVFSLAIAVALARISVFVPSSLMIVSKVNCLQFFSADYNFGDDWLDTVCHELGLLGADFHAISRECFVQLFHLAGHFFLFFSATPLISSANLSLVIIRPPMLTVPEWSFKASVMIRSRKMLNNVGDSRHPWQTPGEIRDCSKLRSTHAQD